MSSDKITHISSSQNAPESLIASEPPTTATSNVMQPNTSSPHHRNLQEQECEPFSKYVENAISQEMSESVSGLFVQMDRTFKTIGTDNSRDVMYFGEYSYRYSGIEHDATPIPPEISALIEAIRPELPNSNMVINSCLVSRYKTGQNYIPPHRDDEAVINPESDIITLSIGANRLMTFTNNSGNIVKQQMLHDCSMLVFDRLSQNFWQHSIDKCQSTDIRYSLTLRHIDPHFINSTILLGDSNTQFVNFGDGEGTLGAWMPGKRIKVGHIESIPDPIKIGPYRNIVIHTGINSINNPKFRQSNKALINELESKIRNISNMYTKSKIFVSLLLPSRSVPLNYRINDFNNLILDMTCRLDRVHIVDHSISGNKLTDEHGRWTQSHENSDTYVPNVNDILHLEKRGIRVFAKNLKQVVVGNRNSQSVERFNGGRGSYRRAVLHGRGRPRRNGGRAAERGASTASSRVSPQTGGARRSPHRGGHNENRFSALTDYHGD